VPGGKDQRTLHVVTGCTGVGKTEWAMRWAGERGAEIVSCDSLLFYRGMDIGTAKPTAAERALVPHHLIDIRDVAEPVDVSQFARLAREAVEGIAARGRPVLVVGGSGFYLKTFFGPVADEVAVGTGQIDWPAVVRAAEEVGVQYYFIEDETSAPVQNIPKSLAYLRSLNP